MGRLYLVSTPIGNLQDITLRAIEVLSKADIIACEDTRKTGMLLQRVEIQSKSKLISYYEENELRRIPEIILLLQEGKNVALVSNAGTPTISDPGYKLVRECIQQGIEVQVIPGASAVLAALVSSGLPTDKFLFLGYLPKKQGKRKTLLEKLLMIYRYINISLVFYESPNRLVKTLEDLITVFSDIEIVICRELTKIHEEIRREKISEAIEHFEAVNPKGEFTILFHFSFH